MSRRPPILKTTATTGEGLGAVADAISEHHEFLVSSGLLGRHQEEDARHQVVGIARQLIVERLLQAMPGADMDSLVGRVAAREAGPAFGGGGTGRRRAAIGSHAPVVRSA